jgi:hypothetical protein
MNWGLRWIECHPGFAGYLQAFGVVLAIGASALISYLTTPATLKPIRDERESRARVTTFRLMPVIMAIQAKVKQIRQTASETQGGFLLADNEVQDAIPKFSIPFHVEHDLLAGSHILDNKAAATVAQLDFYLNLYNEFIDTRLPKLREMDGAARGEYTFRFFSLLDSIEGFADTIEGALGTNHDAFLNL